MRPEGTRPTDVLGPITIVLGDAKVLYPRVLRDYLVYASDQGAIAPRWSREILEEVIEHLAETIASFTPEQGDLLIRLLNRAFPYAEVAPSPAARRKVSALVLPDEDDRHVLTAAVAPRADILCTDNIKDFPREAMEAVGIELLSADALLARLVTANPAKMLAAHRSAVASLAGATDASTVAALNARTPPRPPI
ncbi:MAG TPA: PIN domain-containing protein [Marmoricola sp.]|nr:PIN domain-containing protein [Marmoricola sp.]